MHWTIFWGCSDEYGIPIVSESRRKTGILLNKWILTIANTAIIIDDNTMVISELDLAQSDL